MQAFLVSTGVVALGEMGDKTQLLAMLLAVKFRRPLPIVLGIVVATVFNHATAGLVGAWVAKALGAELLRWVIGVSFIAMAAWMLVPDKIEGDEASGPQRFGVFGTTLGMMIANVPAVFAGGAIAKRVPMKLVHTIAAAIFVVLGVLTLLNVGKLF